MKKVGSSILDELHILVQIDDGLIHLHFFCQCVNACLLHFLRGTSHIRTHHHAVAVDKAIRRAFEIYVSVQDGFDHCAEFEMHVIK